MAFVPKTWVDRAVEFAGRYLLTAVSGQANTYDLSRAEGTQFVVGDKPDATNLNDLESRIKNEFDTVCSEISALTTEYLLDVGTYSGGTTINVGTSLDAYRLLCAEYKLSGYNNSSVINIQSLKSLGSVIQYANNSGNTNITITRVSDTAISINAAITVLKIRLIR